MGNFFILNFNKMTAGGTVFVEKFRVDFKILLDKRCIGHRLKLLVTLLLVGLLESFFAVAYAIPAASEPLVITYPSVNDRVQREFDNYYLALLKLGLDKAKVNYQTKPISISPIAESRSEFNLLQNRYSVHWLHTSPKREAELRAVRIPLFKGLTGWRIFFIQKGHQHRFLQLRNEMALKALVAGQGHDWPDTKILQANHYRVETSPQWASLFKMLSIGRFDYYPRSAIEIWREKSSFSHLDIEIEQSVALRYPTAYYFFVSPKNEALASAIEKGLHIAIQDGSFDLIFYRYLGEYIEKAQLSKRVVYHLKNPLSTFPKNKKLWYTPHSKVGG